MVQFEVKNLKITCEGPRQGWADGPAQAGKELTTGVDDQLHWEETLKFTDSGYQILYSTTA